MDFTPLIASTWAMLCWFSLLMLHMLKSLWAKATIDGRQARLLTHWAWEIYRVISIDKFEFGKALAQSKCWQTFVIASSLQAIDSSMPEQKPRSDIVNTSSGDPLSEISFCAPKKLILEVIINHIIDLTTSHDKSISIAVQKIDIAKQEQKPL